MTCFKIQERQTYLNDIVWGYLQNGLKRKAMGKKKIVIESGKGSSLSWPINCNCKCKCNFNFILI